MAKNVDSPAKKMNSRVSREKTEKDTDIFDEILEEKAEKEKDKKEDEEEKEDVTFDEEDEGQRTDDKSEYSGKEGNEEKQADEEESSEDTDDFEYSLEREEDSVEHGVKEKELDEVPLKELGKNREEIKDTIIHKASLLSLKDKGPAETGLKLNFLSDPATGNVFIGRKKAVHKKYGYEGALHVGRVNEQEFKDKDIYLDSLNPHVVFVCGARGSGKSYVMGVIAEEIALKNKNVGTIVIDPIGVFWSMRFPNREERELEKIKEWKLNPLGLKNIRVFVPAGIRGQVPKTTFDAGFSMQPSLLSSEDWALTFKIDRFSVTGLLLEKVLKKVESGYKSLEDKKIPAKGRNYSLDDIVICLESDAELNSREKGYKQDSIRALSSRFEAAKAWGIFDEKGTPLSDLSREGQMTILDTSFLDDTVTALVIGVLARRILAARKISTRKEAASRFKTLDVDQLLELEIPPTWLFIDEAHTLIPSGNEKTPASSALVEYVKQGRRPGCSLVFATQQPSAIDTKVLSQLDIIMTHKLVFDDDVKAVFKRTPTIIPAAFKRKSFIKTLPVGVALTGDRSEETSRAFIMSIRPRLSQHEGRDAETLGMSETVSAEQLENLIVEVVHRDLLKEGEIEIEKIKKVIETLNAKYNGNAHLSAILQGLREKGFIVGQKTVMLEGAKGDRKIAKEIIKAESGEEEETGEEGEALKGEPLQDVETTELLALPQRIPESRAKEIVNEIRKKRLLGLLGGEEVVRDTALRYHTVWKVNYDVVSTKNEFLSRQCFISSSSGEFLHFSMGKFVESKGLNEFFELGEDELSVLKALMKNQLSAEELIGITEFGEGKVLRIMKKLGERGLVGLAVEQKTGKKIYWLKQQFDLPPSERHELLGSINYLPFVRADAISKEHELFGKEKIPELLQKMWKNVIVKSIEEIYRPVWHFKLELDGKERTVLVDGVTGKVI